MANLRDERERERRERETREEAEVNSYLAHCCGEAGVEARVAQYSDFKLYQLYISVPEMVFSMELQI